VRHALNERAVFGKQNQKMFIFVQNKGKVSKFYLKKIIEVLKCMLL